VVLRGGLDGLHVAAPTHDPNYAATRGGVALDPATLLSLDGSFRLHPSMPKFKALYDAGEAALVHAIAPPLRIRSHFECQYNLESGYPDRVVAGDGWLNRLLQKLPAGNPVGDRGALEVGPTPFILAGRAPVMSWSPGGWPRSELMNTRIVDLYRRTDPSLHDKLVRGLAAHRLATAENSSAGFDPKVRPTGLQSAFRGAGRLMAAANGPRIAVLNIGGWDTHTRQILTLNANLKNLDNALDDFRIAIGGDWSRTAVVCVTEFGRTAAANKTSGTDHGVGTVAFLAGGAIDGGKVIADWPGLALANLQDGRDLKPTLDLRAVFKGLLMDHLGVPKTILDADVFPSSSNVSPMQGLIRSGTAPAIASAASRSSTAATDAGHSPALERFRSENGVM